MVWTLFGTEGGGISVIYQSLALHTQKTPYMLAWESDLAIEWEVDKWRSSFDRAFKGIKNISLIESSVKVITRWYFTPAKLSKMFPTVDPKCFRGCQLLGSMAHVWWECPRLRPF